MIERYSYIDHKSKLKVCAIKRNKPHQDRMKDSGLVRLQNGPLMPNFEFT